jgi:hypothetical protein
LGDQNLPSALAYKVVKLGKQIEEEIAAYSKLRDDIEKKYVEADDQSNMMNEMAELAKIPIDTEFHLIPLSEFLAADIRLPPKSLAGLLPFFPDDQVEE